MQPLKKGGWGRREGAAAATNTQQWAPGCQPPHPLVTAFTKPRAVAKAVEGRVSPTALLHVSYYDMSFFARIFGLEDAEETRERVEELRGAVLRLDEEWTEDYGNFRDLQMREAKQTQRREDHSSHDEPQWVESDGNTGLGD